MTEKSRVFIPYPSTDGTKWMIALIADGKTVISHTFTGTLEEATGISDALNARAAADHHEQFWAEIKRDWDQKYSLENIARSLGIDWHNSEGDD